MQLWCCTVQLGGAARFQGDVEWLACSQHSGQQTFGECAAFWNVQQFGEPHRGRCDSCCVGSVDADALHASNACAVGARLFCRHGRRCTCIELHFQIDVYVGWRDPGGDAWSIDGNAAMTQYVFTLSSRMVAIASTCVVLLGILLFLLGVEIGKLWVANAAKVRAPTSSSYAAPAGTAPAMPVSPTADVAQGKAP